MKRLAILSALTLTGCSILFSGAEYQRDLGMDAGPEGGICQDESMGACEGGCFDLLESSLHCGACGNACGAGIPCRLGVCDRLDPDAEVDFIGCDRLSACAGGDFSR